MATRYDSNPIPDFRVFDNEVLEQKLENQLITRLDMNQFVTMDYQLSENPGMVKKIRTYVGTGDVEDLAMGVGNSVVIGAEFVESDYRVEVTQGTAIWYDEQQMADPKAIDKAIEHLGEALTNDVTKKVVGELRNATNSIASLDFDGIVDAIAEFPDEENPGMYLLMNRKAYAALQKECKDELKYVEAFVRSGYVGHLAGVPIFVSKALDNEEEKAEAYLASKDAITCFMKKGVQMETMRDPGTRSTAIVGRNVKVIAATNLDKIFQFIEA